MVSPALLRWAISAPVSETVMWCVVAEPGAHRLTSPDPCVYTHRPEEAGKHSPLIGTYVALIMCDLLLMCDP